MKAIFAMLTSAAVLMMKGDELPELKKEISRLEYCIPATNNVDVALLGMLKLQLEKVNCRKLYEKANLFVMTNKNVGCQSPSSVVKMLDWRHLEDGVKSNVIKQISTQLREMGTPEELISAKCQMVLDGLVRRTYVAVKTVDGCPYVAGILDVVSANVRNCMIFDSLGHLEFVLCRKFVPGGNAYRDSLYMYSQDGEGSLMTIDAVGVKMFSRNHGKWMAIPHDYMKKRLFACARDKMRELLECD